MSEQQVIDVRDQRRALAAGGDVAFAEIRNDADVSAFGEDGCFADLERAGDAMPQISDGGTLVKNGLAVHSAELDGGEEDARAAARVDQSKSVEVAKKKIEPRDGRGVRDRIGDSQEGFADRCGIGRAVERDGRDADGAALADDIDDGNVDAIEGGP